ncbi:MAG: cation:proton antiporter [Bacteroidales bacterium]
MNWIIINMFHKDLDNPVFMFTLILLIILLSPLLLKKLRIPGIIGLILSGVIFGPHGFGLIEQNAAVDLFSTIGLLYLMFIAGLELDLDQFKKTRNKSMTFGLLTFSIPLMIGLPVCYYLLGYSFWPSLLIASMFSTHTLVAYPIVRRFGISRNQEVAITVGGTIFTDSAVLIMLALILSTNQGDMDAGFWIQISISIVMFITIMFVVIPRVAKWFFRKMETDKHSHYIFVLLIIFIAALMAWYAGLEPIIGAFVSGLVLNRLIPQSSVLMNRIEFIGSSLFIPFFLISVGMLVDIGVILKGYNALIIAGTLTIVALFGKWLAALLTRIIFNFSRQQGLVIFGLSSSHAAATIAVILVGFNAGLLDENVLNGTIILVLITCLVASFVTEKAARKIAIELTDQTFDQQKTDEILAERILLPVANMMNFEKLLDFAILIKEKKSPNPITTLTVVPNNEEAEANILKARTMVKSKVLEAAEAETHVSIMTAIDHSASSGISRIAREVMADLIILGWPQRSGVLEKIIGNRMDSILNSTDKTTFICHLDQPLVSHKRIILVSPPLAEHEQGFTHWLGKIDQLAKELSISIVHYCSPATQMAVEKWMHSLGTNSPVIFQPFDYWESFPMLAEESRQSDMMIFVSARKGSISHSGMLDNTIRKLENHFDRNNRIIIFPQQHKISYLNERYEDMDSRTIEKGIDTLQRIGKGFSSFFKKEE